MHPQLHHHSWCAHYLQLFFFANVPTLQLCLQMKENTNNPINYCVKKYDNSSIKSRTLNMVWAIILFCSLTQHWPHILHLLVTRIKLSTFLLLRTPATQHHPTTLVSSSAGTSSTYSTTHTHLGAAWSAATAPYIHYTATWAFSIFALSVEVLLWIAPPDHALIQNTPFSFKSLFTHLV